MTHLQKFVLSLKEKNIDAAIITDTLNQKYLSSFDFDDGQIVVTQEGSFLLTDFRYLEAAKKASDPELCILTPKGNRTLAIGELLHSTHAKNVILEDETLPYKAFLTYAEMLPEFCFHRGASEILNMLRIHKDNQELEKIANAQKITDAAFSHVLKVMTPNMTEIDVALELETYMKKNGASGLAFSTIAVSGTNSSRPHGVPGFEKLQKGFLTMDFGAKYDGYCSDMTRTIVLGKADVEMKRLYNTVLTAQKNALQAAEEGFSTKKLDTIARDIIHQAGYEGCFGHSLGHGVGLFIHESPRLSQGAKDTDVLERGHVVTFEPGIYLEGKYGCRIEDMVCIQNDGSLHNFTQSPKELIELF